MKYFQIVAAIAFACFVSANAQGDEVFIRNVCDTLASKGHDPVTLVATDLIETKWVASKKSGNWTHGTATKATHTSYSTLSPIVKSVSGRFPLSIEAGCRANSNMLYKYMRWNEFKWSRDSLSDFSTYIFDTHNRAIGDYDSTNANNILAMVSELPVDKDSYNSDEIMISKSFEFAFEWWLAAAEISWKKANGATSKKFFNVPAFDSLTAFRAMFDYMKATIDTATSVPDTISTANIQVIKVVLKDSEKTTTIIEPASSSSVVPPSSSSDKPQSSATQSSSSSDTPKSSAVNSSSSDVPKSSSSSDTPKSSAVQSSSSSKDTPASSSSGDTPKSSSSDTPECSDSKSSSSEGSEAIATVRTEFVDEEIVEVRGLDGRLVKNSGNVKPGIYYAKTSRGTWFKKVVLPRGE
ncbi:MAG: hypothetical protein IKX42_06850 [Fibrobacter sp.]|nr:hypothetical protein [Fibrobacter sp.]